MANEKFSDIVLDPHDLDEIEDKIEEHNHTVYGGKMDSHSKRVMREMLRREYKEGIWASRDYINGYDEGEPNKGDIGPNGY